MKLEDRMRRSISRRASDVILRTELSALGSATQVTEALKALQRKGVIVRIGTGVYSKTRTSSVTGATILAGSLETLAVEALRKLGVEVTAGRTAAAYNAGGTTQIPGAFVANTGRRRISRRIIVGGREVIYENNYRQAA